MPISIFIYNVSYLSILKSSDEGTALAGTGTHRLSPALTEQTGHRRFVGQSEGASILDVEEEWEQKNVIILSILQSSLFKYIFLEYNYIKKLVWG